MTRQNVISLYLALSAVNGIIPFGIAILFSVPVLGVLAIWVLATMITFTLICLVSSMGVVEETDLKARNRDVRCDIKRAYF
jgi:hypothetical protein